MFRTERPLDNPLNWSFRAGRLFGIDIRVHVAFVICAIILVWMEIPKEPGAYSPPLGRVLVDALGTYAILFFIVLLHEFGHCFGARHTGGEADEILLWPLGGLASTSPPHHPTAHLITTVAGPVVNVLLCAICTAVLIFWTGSLGGVPWNPLHPTTPVDTSIYLAASDAQLWTMRFFGISYFLLLVNLLPIFPFDGGRIVQALLWPSKGYKASMGIATTTGMIGAAVVGLFGLFTEKSWLLLMIAIFGYMSCYQTRRMLREFEEFGGGELDHALSRGYGSFDGGEEPAERKPGFFERRRLRKSAERAERERQRREEHEQAVEAVLRKISESGIGSLTPRERRVLEEETERQRSRRDESSNVL